MGQIVVGIDESVEAAEALRWAVREAELRSRGVTVVMAWGYLDQRHADGSGFRPDYSADDAAETLSQLVARAVPDAAAAIELRPICDLPARALLEASADAELLVVGSRGHGGLVGPFLGSVSQQCVHHAATPIAVVRNSERPDMSERSKVVVGVDGSAEAARALDWAIDEARLRAAPLTVVHAWRWAAPGPMEYAAPMLDVSSLEAAAKTTVDNALAAADTEGLVSPVVTTVVDGPAGAAVLDAAQDAALIVVGSRGRGGFANLLLGSVSSRVVHHADCPVVVVPPADRRPIRRHSTD